MREQIEQALLVSQSVRERDDLQLALAHIDDPASLPTLRTVLRRESEPLARKLVQQTIDQLVATGKMAK